MDISKQLNPIQKAALKGAYELFRFEQGGLPVPNVTLQSGIEGLLFELNKGARGGYVDTHYLREKVGQICEVVEDPEPQTPQSEGI